jgi:hypothetical protein
MHPSRSGNVTEADLGKKGQYDCGFLIDPTIERMNLH